MKLILSADWHIRATAPRIRKDEYWKVQYSKVKWILEEAVNKEADVCVAGDIFDAPRCPYWLLIKYMDLFKKFQNKIYVVPGQHDLHFHNPDLNNTPLGALLSANLVEIPDNNFIRGTGWEEEIPEQESSVLMIHTPCTPDEPPFFMKDAVSAEDILEELGESYNLIITGDYHVPHCHITETSILCNPGPIMRASKDKMGHIPRVYLYDSDYGSIEMIEIPVESDVFDEESLLSDERKEYGEELKELISSFKSNKNYIGYWDVLEYVLRTVNPNKSVKDVINTVKEKVHGNS